MKPVKGYTKGCKPCRRIQPVSGFANSQSSRDGFLAICKRCKLPVKKGHTQPRLKLHNLPHLETLFKNLRPGGKRQVQVFNVNTDEELTLEFMRESDGATFRAEIWGPILAKDQFRLKSLTVDQFLDFINELLYARALRITLGGPRDILVYGLRSVNPPPLKPRIKKGEWEF